jgi:hypothetical protein
MALVDGLLRAIGPALDLLGWIALAGALACFVWAWAARRRHARWAAVEARVTVLEGQLCLVWQTEDGATISRLLEEDDAGPAPRAGTTPTPSGVLPRTAEGADPQPVAPAGTPGGPGAQDPVRTIYQQRGSTLHWRTTPPEDSSVVARRIGWAFLVLALACNAVGLLQAASF